MPPDAPLANESTLEALINSLTHAVDNIITWVTLVLFGLLIAFVIPLVLRARRVPRTLDASLNKYLERSTRESSLSDVPAGGVASAIHATLTEFNRGLVNGSTRGSDSESHPFDAQRLLAECKIGWLPFGLVQLAPGIFTALGLLGTFFGVSFALGFLKVGDNELRGSMDYVISGLASAFWTSIFGVIASIFAAVTGRVAENRVEHAVEEANEKLQKEFELHTTSSELDELTKTVRSIPDAIRAELGSFTRSLFDPILKEAAALGVGAAKQYAEHFAQGLTEGIGKSLLQTTSLAEKHVSAVLETLGAAGQGVADQVRQTNLAVAANLSSLVEASKGVSAATEGVRSATKMAFQLLEASVDATKATTDQAAKIKEEMKQLAKLETAQTKRHDRQAEMLNTLDSAAANLAAASNQANVATGRLDEFSKHLTTLTSANQFIAERLERNDKTQVDLSTRQEKLHKVTMDSISAMQVRLKEVGAQWASVEASMKVVANLSQSIAPLEKLPAAVEKTNAGLELFSNRVGNHLGRLDQLESSLTACVASLGKVREGMDTIVNELVRELDEQR